MDQKIPMPRKIAPATNQRDHSPKHVACLNLHEWCLKLAEARSEGGGRQVPMADETLLCFSTAKGGNYSIKVSNYLLVTEEELKPLLKFGITKEIFQGLFRDGMLHDLYEPVKDLFDNGDMPSIEVTNDLIHSLKKEPDFLSQTLASAYSDLLKDKKPSLELKEVFDEITQNSGWKIVPSENIPGYLFEGVDYIVAMESFGTTEVFDSEGNVGELHGGQYILLSTIKGEVTPQRVREEFYSKYPKKTAKVFQKQAEDATEKEPVKAFNAVPLYLIFALLFVVSLVSSIVSIGLSVAGLIVSLVSLILILTSQSD